MKERNVLSTPVKSILLPFCMVVFSLLQLQAQTAFVIESENVDKGDTVTLDVTTEDFQGIASIQLSHNFDSTVLQYVDITNINPSLSGLSSQGPGGTIKNGEIVVNWFDQSGGTTNLSDGSLLYNMRFVAIGNECDSTDVNVSNTPRKIEVLDNNLDELPFTSTTGEVKINGTDCISLPDVTFRLNQNSGQMGTEVCLQLRVDGFQEIEAFQWSLKWDQSVATFSRVANLNLQSLNAGDFNFDMTNEALRCIWDDDQGNAISVPNATRIADICFTLVGNPMDMTDVFFSDSPLAIEVSRKDVPTPVPTTTQAGKLTINAMGGNPVELILCEQTGIVNESICMPIKVRNFVDVQSFQFSFTLPNRVAVADPNSRNHALPGFGTDKVSSPMAGVVRTLWTDPGGGCQTLPDNTVLFELCLQADEVGTYPIDFSNTPLRIEITDCDGIELDVNTQGPADLIVNPGGNMLSVTLRDTLKVRCADRCRGFISTNLRGGSGDYTIRWTENGSPRPDLDDQDEADELCGGIYQIIVCDEANPTDCDTLIVNLFRPTPIEVLSEDITPATNGCNGEIELNVGGGKPQYFFRWDANASNQTSNPATNLCKGIYNCTITDSENCTFITDSFRVTGAPIIIEEPSITEPGCFGDCDGAIDVTVSGGCGPLSFAWTVVSGMGTINNPSAEDQSGLCAGQYKVVVTDTSGGMSMSTFTVNQPDEIIIGLDSIQNGNPGSAFVTVTGGTTTMGYVTKWTDLSGNLISQNEDLTNVPPGTYINMVTDDNGCVGMDTFIISDRDLSVVINLSMTQGGTNVSCNGECDGTATAVVSMGSGMYSYAWSHDNMETGNMVLDLCAGSYSVTVQDLQSGSTTVENFDITEPAVLEVEVFEMSCASAVGAADGAYRAVATGGSSPYNYLWCNNSTSSVPTNLVGGSNCNVLITDANGCQIFEDDIIICNDGGPVEPTDCFNSSDVITPNGDGLNDGLKINCVNDPRFSDNRLYIFNRRGQLVNEYRNYTNGEWQGTDESGNLVTEDAYMWVLEITLSTGQKEIERGAVTVILN